MSVCALEFKGRTSECRSDILNKGLEEDAALQEKGERITSIRICLTIGEQMLRREGVLVSGKACSPTSCSSRLVTLCSGTRSTAGHGFGI